MSEFHDPQFEHALGRLSGEFPDDNVALGAVYQRVQQVRRRRTIVASSTASLLLMVGIGVAAARGVYHEPLQPSASISASHTTVATTDSTTTTAPMVPVTTTKPAHSTTTIETTTTTLPLVVVPTGPPVNAGGSHRPGHGGTPTTVPPITTTHTTPTTATATTTAPTTTVAPGEVSSYYTPGGWFTVRFANGMLTLVSVHTLPGFAIDSQTVESQRIEFRFRGQFGDYRTRVEVKHGQLQISH